MRNIYAHFKKAEIRTLVNKIRLYGKDKESIAKLSLMWKVYKISYKQHNSTKKQLELSTL
jgi:hypothetical protein